MDIISCNAVIVIGSSFFILIGVSIEVSELFVQLSKKNKNKNNKHMKTSLCLFLQKGMMSLIMGILLSLGLLSYSTRLMREP